MDAIQEATRKATPPERTTLLGVDAEGASSLDVDMTGRVTGRMIIWVIGRVRTLNCVFDEVLLGRDALYASTRT